MKLNVGATIDKLELLACMQEIMTAIIFFFKKRDQCAKLASDGSNVSGQL